MRIFSLLTATVAVYLFLAEQLTAQVYNAQEIRFLCAGSTTSIFKSDSAEVSGNADGLVFADQDGRLSVYRGESLLGRAEGASYAAYTKCILDLSKLQPPTDARLERLENLVFSLANRCESGNADQDGSSRRLIMSTISRLEENAAIDQDALEEIFRHFLDVEDFCLEQLSVMRARTVRSFLFSDFTGAIIPHRFFLRRDHVDISFDLFVAGKRCGGRWSSRNRQNVEFCDISGGDTFELRNIELFTRLIPPSMATKLPEASGDICDGEFDFDSADGLTVFICFDGDFVCDLIATRDSPSVSGSLFDNHFGSLEEGFESLQSAREACFFRG